MDFTEDLGGPEKGPHLMPYYQQLQKPSFFAYPLGSSLTTYTAEPLPTH